MRQDRIDVHHHVLPQFFRDAQTAGGYPSTAYRPFPDWSPETSLALMDRLGIATAILSFSAPGLYYGDRAACRDLAMRCNDYLAGLIARHGRRFGALAALPFPDVDDCLAEIERSQDIGLDGFMHLTRNDDRPAGHADFEEIYRELDRRRAVVLLHPTYPAASAERDYIVPRPIVDYPCETARATASLLFNGVLARMPISASSCPMPAARCRRSPTGSRSSTGSPASARTIPTAPGPISGGSITTPRSRATRRCWPRCKASPGRIG